MAVSALVPPVEVSNDNMAVGCWKITSAVRKLSKMPEVYLVCFLTAVVSIC